MGKELIRDVAHPLRPIILIGERLAYLRLICLEVLGWLITTLIVGVSARDRHPHYNTKMISGTHNKKHIKQKKETENNLLNQACESLKRNVIQNKNTEVTQK